MNIYKKLLISSKSRHRKGNTYIKFVESKSLFLACNMVFDENEKNWGNMVFDENEKNCSNMVFDENEKNCSNMVFDENEKNCSNMVFDENEKNWSNILVLILYRQCFNFLNNICIDLFQICIGTFHVVSI